jgi:hypothetical protein
LVSPAQLKSIERSGVEPGDGKEGADERDENQIFHEQGG